VSRGPQIVGDNQRTKSGWQFDAAIVRIAHWLGLTLRERKRKDAKRSCESGHSRSAVEERHRKSPVLTNELRLSAYTEALGVTITGDLNSLAISRDGMA
jgi:hypothetical protein